MKTQQKSEYDIQAETFLAECKVIFKAIFLFHGPHWEGDKENRNVWELTLERFHKDKPIERLTVRFGQSIADSFVWPVKHGGSILVGYAHPARDRSRYGEAGKQPTKRNIPTPYDMLSCLTKTDPGTFDSFCGEFGYDTDSRKVEKTYFAVQEEWNKVRKFFTADEIENLQEIN